MAHVVASIVGCPLCGPTCKEKPLVSSEARTHGPRQTRGHKGPIMKHRIAGAVGLLAWVAAALAPSAAARRYPEGAGHFNVRDFGASGDGRTDDTAAFAKAIEAVKMHFQVIYVPNGTYLVSDRIAWGNWITLQGQSREHTIIKLKDKCPGYTDPGKPKAVVVTGARGPYYGGDSRANAAFSNYVRNLTVDTGRGNPGAVGIRFTTHNHGVVEQVTIRSSDGAGQVGLDLSDTEFGPGMVRAIRVQGFDVGIKTPGKPSSCVLENVTLQGQKVAGMENHLPVSVRGLISDNEVPAVRNSGPLAQFVLIDGQLRGGAPEVCAIESEAPYYLRNVETSGYKAALSDRGRIIPGAQIDSRIGGRKHSLFEGPKRPFRLSVRDVPAVFPEPVSRWVVPDASADDDTKAVQEAIDSGAKTIFLPSTVQYHISDTIVLRGAVRRVLALKHHHGNLRAIDPKTRFADKPMLRVEGRGKEPLTIESVHLSAWPTKNSRIEVATSRPVYIKYVWFRGVTVLPETRCRLFIDETGGELRLNPGQSVWIRQYNPENNPFPVAQRGKGKLPRTYVINRGGNLWVLGMKTESPAVHAVTTDGGRTEILGGFFRDHFGPDQYTWHGDPPLADLDMSKGVPYWITKDASLAATYFQYAWRPGKARSLQAIEIRDGETRCLQVAPVSYAMGLYLAAHRAAPSHSDAERAR